MLPGKRFKAIFHPFIFVYHVEKRFRCSIEIRGKALWENSVTSRQFDDVFFATEAVELMLPGTSDKLSSLHRPGVPWWFITYICALQEMGFSSLQL